MQHVFSVPDGKKGCSLLCERDTTHSYPVNSPRVVQYNDSCRRLENGVENEVENRKSDNVGGSRGYRGRLNDKHEYIYPNAGKDQALRLVAWFPPYLVSDFFFEILEELADTMAFGDEESAMRSRSRKVVLLRRNLPYHSHYPCGRPSNPQKGPHV